jgi:UPF0042 nucleotide-binding protein
MLSDIRAFVEKWLPSFKTDNRSYLTVALGCTGGQHRSVYMAEKLAAYFHATERVVLRHREQSAIASGSSAPAVDSRIASSTSMSATAA